MRRGGPTTRPTAAVDEAPPPTAARRGRSPRRVAPRRVGRRVAPWSPAGGVHAEAEGSEGGYGDAPLLYTQPARTRRAGSAVASAPPARRGTRRPATSATRAPRTTTTTTTTIHTWCGGGGGGGARAASVPL